MLPENWLPYVFPTDLRTDRIWIGSFAKNRRTYLLGFNQAAGMLGRVEAQDIRRQLSPQFAEDPRRFIPVDGWRKLFPVIGDTRMENSELYKNPPPEVRRSDCKKWGQFGKDQVDHAWLRRTMRLYDAIKAIALLHEAEGESSVVLPSQNGIDHIDGQVSLHIAIFQLTGFDTEYFSDHFEGNTVRLAALYQACGLKSRLYGTPTNTFLEMALGMSATYRTCLAIQKFCTEAGFPDVGTVQADLSVRGTNRNLRKKIKEDRKGPMQHYSQDCAVEIFI